MGTRVDTQAQGASDNLLKKLMLEDPTTYMRVFRLACEKFKELWIKIHPFMQKKDTLMRPAVPSQIKLKIILRFLAAVDSFTRTIRSTSQHHLEISARPFFCNQICVTGQCEGRS